MRSALDKLLSSYQQKSQGKFAADANNDGYVSAADEAYAGMRGFRTRPDGRDEDEEGATTPLTSYPSSGEPKSQFDSPDQAARAVMLARASGRGLEAGKIMQDPNYELGSGSSLRQAPRQLGTQSGRIKRLAREARKQGYSGAANQLFSAYAAQKLGEGSAITREGDRASKMLEQEQISGQTRALENLSQKMIDYQNRLLDSRMKRLEQDEPDVSEPRMILEDQRKREQGSGTSPSGRLYTGGLKTGGLTTSRFFEPYRTR